MRVRRVQAGVAAALLASLPAPAQQAVADVSPVTDAMLADPDPADWLMWRRTLDSWGYSPLDQIDRDTVGQLRLVWSRGLHDGTQEGTPLVHDGVLFFPNPNDIVQALDAATGDLIWEHRRRLPSDLGDYLPVSDINRNLAIHGGLIIDTSADDYVYALDARTGEQVWETQVDDYQTGSQQTSGPIIAGGRVVSGRGCEVEGGPEACVITAHDPETGRELWRTRTIPAPGEPGDETWGDVPYENRVHVGAWMVPSYDPELDMLYVGTSVTAPVGKYALGGADLEHLYHNATLALDAETGAIAWHYQHLVDHWDLDHTFERLLIDTAVAPDPEAVSWINPRLTPGETRKVVTGVPGKTGIVFTLDRETGEFLWARPTIRQNVTSAIDGATGAVTVNPETVFHQDGDEVSICPSSQGGKNWPAGAYSPLTGVMYVPMQRSCSDVAAVPPDPAGFGFLGMAARNRPLEDTDQLGVIYGVSVETGDTAWMHEQRAGMLSLVATGGGLVFGGDGNGRFRAFDQETGAVLWEVNLGSAVTGFPVTYAVDGRQYVAVSTGQWRSGPLTPELRVSGASNLFVFALP